jgi:predicted  nucleic acid-binding Zn ribbon protein
LLRNGQICGDYLIAWHSGVLNAYTHVPQPDAWKDEYHSEYASAQLLKVVDKFQQNPHFEIIDDDVPNEFPSWEQSKFFYLFTHAFDDLSPVCCGDTGLSIPLYLLPVSEETRENLYRWADRYKRLDLLWLDSRALEIQAYRQMADPKSELATSGREYCAEIERATKKRTYFYLTRYWGRNTGEAVRLCPSCGKSWHKSVKVSEVKIFHEFQFRCERCRLVSHIAVSYDDERHARIGEYRKKVTHIHKEN